MKTLPLLFAVTLFLAGAARSQAPLTAAATLSAQLAAVQTANRTLIEQQQKTLDTLEQMRAAAEQIKLFAKRG